MTLDDLVGAACVAGARQAAKAVRRGDAAALFLAADADPRVLEGLREAAAACGVPVFEEARMARLGRAAGLAVGSAAVALLKGSAD